MIYVCTCVCEQEREREKLGKRQEKAGRERGEGDKSSGGAVILVLENFISDIKTSIK